MTAALAASCAVAVVVNLLLKRHLHGPGSADMALYFWPVQLPAFVAGCWLATLARAGALPKRGARLALVLAILGMVIDSQLRGRSNLLVAIGLLTAFTYAATVVRPRFLESATLSLVGRISFSLYILHFAVIAAFRPLALRAESVLGSVPAFAAVFAATLVVAGGLAWCTYRLIELPMMRAGRGIARQVRTATC